MRLVCDVMVVSRLLESLSLKNSGRKCRTQLSVGHKPGSGDEERAIYLMLCTSKDRNGVKYLLKNNVEHIFTKFVNQGKATVRIRQPQQDLQLSKADPIQLRSFLSVLKQSSLDKSPKQSCLSVLIPAKAKTVEKPKKSLTILQKADYPFLSGFPSSLEQLQVSQCKIKKVDCRMYQLRHLQVLNLSENNLDSLPVEMNMLSLKELRLDKNLFRSFPIILCKGTISETLRCVDLNDNKIEKLPGSISNLQKLFTLKVNSNLLESLPATMEKMNNLQYLLVAYNQLKTLPVGFLKLRFDVLDLSNNPLMDAQPGIIQSQLGVPSLQECSARIVRKHRIPYEDVVHHLCEYVSNTRECCCGNIIFGTFIHYITKISVRLIPASTMLFEKATVPIEAYYCSTRCMNRFSNLTS